MDDLKVFIITRDSKCEQCHTELEKGTIIFLQKEKGASCLECADMDHLVFLRAGDAALTRRSKKYSRLSAVILKFSRARKRYERQGLLVEEEAFDRAEEECAGDEDERMARRGRAAERRAELDQKYIAKFASRIRELYPSIPDRRELKIAEHACRKYSGRVGRSAEAKEFQEEAVSLAVRAHVRHRETDYDDLLMTGYERSAARKKVASKMETVLEEWSK